MLLIRSQWNCLDYIYECDVSDARRVKGKKILSELQQKTAVYQSMRGMRAPVVMDKHVGQREPRVSDKNRSSSSLDQPNKTEHSDASGLKPIFAGPGGPNLLNPGPNLLNPGLPPPIIGRIPVPPDVQFAGVSNGESLWAFPNAQSPEAHSDTTSITGQQGAVAPKDDLMADIDWDAFDALFPPEQQSELDVPGFPFPGVPGQY